MFNLNTILVYTINVHIKLRQIKENTINIKKRGKL